MNRDNQTLRILQYNTQKSREVMADAFSRHDIYDYDILAIQEPYRNPYHNTTYHPAKDHFSLLYFDHEDTRTCIFVNKRIDPSLWNIRHVNGDIGILHLTTANQESISIYNVYNEPAAESRTQTLEVLEQELKKEGPQQHILLLGDFNLHHPQWSGLLTRRPSRTANRLTETLLNARLWQLTPRGMKTHRSYNSNTTIDLAFATHTLREQLIHCKIAHGLDCDSDHLPISLHLNWAWRRAKIRKTRRWASTDVDKLRSVVQEEVHRLQSADLDTPDALDSQVTQLVQILTTAIDKSTPWNNPSPRAVPGFNKECKEACSETQRLRRRWQRSRLDEDRQAYNKARNAKGRLIAKHLKQAHRDRVTEAASTPKGL